MFSRRNAFVGYMVMKLVRNRLRAERRKRARAVRRSEAARYARHVVNDEPVRAAVGVSLLVGVVLGAVAWLVSVSRRSHR